MANLDSGTVEAVIRLLARTANAADEAVDLRAALAIAIDEIARFADWPVGHAYVPAPDGGDRLVSSGIWRLADEEHFKAFRELTEATDFCAGVGLPGRVLQSHKPCWIHDLAVDKNFPRAGQGIEIGLRAGFAVPVLVDGKVAAVMEFFATVPVAHDSYLLILTEEVGKRLGLIFERRQALETVRQQALITDQVSEAVVITNLEGQVIDCNRGAEVIYGYSRDAMLGMMGRDFLADPDWWDGHRPEVLRAVTEKGFWNGQLQFRRPNGAVRTIDVTMTMFRDERGQHSANLSVGRDVTEREQATRALKQQALALEQLSEAVFVTDLQGHIIECNRATEIMYARSREELIGMDGAELSTDADAWRNRRKELYSFLEKEDKWSGPVAFKRSDGAVGASEFSIAALRDEQGARIANVCIARDVSEQDRVNAALLQQAQIIEQLSEAVLVVGVDGRIIDCNPAVTQMSGYTRSELIGMNTKDLTPDPEAWAEALGPIGEVLTESGRWSGIVTVLRKDGEERICELSLSKLENSANPDVDHVTLAHDVTERKELESQLLQAQKMEAVGQLTGGVAHDFNNLLTAILGNLEMVEERVEADPKASRLIGTATDAALKGANLIQQLLAFSRKQPLQPRRIVLNDLMPRMLELMQRTLGRAVEIDIVLPEEELAVLADPVQLESAILNLGINARDAMPAGGRLRITASPASPEALPDQLPGEESGTHFVAIEVSDHGSGMAPSVLERAFEPFFTTKEVGAGSGLGLSMVYGFAQQSGGHVHIDSKPGKGTRVTIFLPEAEAGAEQEESVPKGEATGYHAGTETVLVVEDNADVRDYASNLLASLGYSVVVAENGNEAIALMQGGERIDLLFTDVVLPGGMDGGRLANHFRTVWPQGKILFTSGYTRQAIEKEGRLNPGQRLLPKPYGRKELVAALEAVFAGQDPEG
jgi:PAS domain S-box-containing protein